MRNLILVLALIISVAGFSQKETISIAMMPEGTVLTLKNDYVIPADTAIVYLNKEGDRNNGGSYSSIHLIFKKSNEWRLLKKGTRFTVKAFVNMPHIQSFKFLLEDEEVFLFIDHLIRPMEIKVETMDDFFEVKFPPMKIYGTDEYVAPRDTIIISPLLPAQIDSLQSIEPPKELK